MKYIVANWKDLKPDYCAYDIIVPIGVKVILSPGHNGELGYEIK